MNIMMILSYSRKGENFIMSLFSTNRCKSLSAEYVEESCKAVNEAPDVSEPGDASSVNKAVNEAPDVSEADDIFIDEAIDALLESLNNEE